MSMYVQMYLLIWGPLIGVCGLTQCVAICFRIMKVAKGTSQKSQEIAVVSPTLFLDAVRII